MLIMKRNVFDKFRSSLYLILLLLLFISLASCYPTFKHPIPPPPELKADRQILGTWVRTTKSGSKVQLSIFQRRSSGWVDVVYIYDIDSKVSRDGINVLIFEGYSTFVNKQQFLCLRLRKKDYSYRFQEKDYSHIDTKEVGEFSFYIINYDTPSKDELIIKHFSTQNVEKLIKEGKLKGEVVKEDVFKGQPFDKVTVTILR